MLSPMKQMKFVRNRNTLLTYCREYITGFEEELDKESWQTSCKEDLLKAIKEEIDSMPEDIADLNDKDYNLREISMRMISTNSFEFFEYGKFHLGGSVNWATTSARRMVAVHRKAIQWALDKGIITEEDKEEDELALQEAIRQRL